MQLTVDLLGVSPLLTGSIAALTSHAVFVHHDPSPRVVLLVYLCAWLVWPAWQIVHFHRSMVEVSVSTALLTASYSATLLASIAFYRTFLHRLRRFPGPLSLKLSKWSSVSMDVKGHRPRVMADLHRTYGDIVRIGPRELSINDPTAVQAILGGKSKLVKSPWYTQAHARKGVRGLNLFSLVDIAQRRARRKIWDKAFSVKALSTYEPDLRKFTDAIMQKIEHNAGQGRALNVDEWCMFFAFDIMGQIGFSKSFDMTGQGQFTDEVRILENFLSGAMTLGNVPYVGGPLSMVPNPIQPFEDYTKIAVEERLRLADKEKGAANGIPDLFAHLLGEQEPTGYTYTMRELCSEAGLMIIAGSDTSSSTLALALFSLASDHAALERLRKELESVFGTDVAAIENFDVLAKECVYLTAVIDETLRLYPPVASGVQREVPTSSSGVAIPLRDGGNVYLPPGTVVSLPTATIQRDPRNFGEDADQFRPERWMKKGAEQEAGRNVMIPFGYGPTGCVGKQLAYMEMRIFLAQFVTRFDFRLPEGFNVDKFKDGIIDTFTMTRKVPLELEITKRHDK